VGIIFFVVGILVSIAIHELGHLLPAKKFGVKVFQYMVGFGPTIWSRMKNGTEYGIKAIPLGGYVRLMGMVPPPPPGAAPVKGPFAGVVQQAREQTIQEIKDGDAAHAFYRLPPGKKIVVMAGGPIANILFAAVILLLVFVGIGIPRPTAVIENVVACVPTAGASAATPSGAATPSDATDCGPGGEATPAALIGLQQGDEIISLDGVPTPDWPALSEAISANSGSGIDLVYQRDGQEFNAFVRLAAVERVDASSGETVSSGFLGIAPSIKLQRQSPLEVPMIMGAMTGAMFEAVATFPARVADVARAAAGEERDPEGLVGIIGASRVGGEIAASETPVLWRVIDLLVLLAGLNVALAIFNLIPLPPLDGGHIAGALFEAVRRGWARLRGKPVPAPADVARLLPFAYGVVAVLIGISILVAYADIVNPIRLGG